MMIESRDKLMRNYVSEKFKNAMPSECRSFSRKWDERGVYLFSVGASGCRWWCSRARRMTSPSPAFWLPS